MSAMPLRISFKCIRNATPILCENSRTKFDIGLSRRGGVPFANKSEKVCECDSNFVLIFLLHDASERFRLKYNVVFRERPIQKGASV